MKIIPFDSVKKFLSINIVKCQHYSDSYSIIRLGADVYFSAPFLNTVNNTNENLDKYNTGQTYVC
jgi:hypothetical protein